MSLTKPKFVPFESYAEAAFYSEKSLPTMGATIVKIAPLVLEVPLFSVARNVAGVKLDATWSRKGRGTLRYRGAALTQSHETLFLTLVHVRSGQVVDNIIEFEPAELLEAMGWSSKNSRNVERLREMLDDMFEARLDVWGVDAGNNDAVSTRFFSDMHTPAKGKWSVVLSLTVLELFKGSLTHVNLRKRTKLREGLATFLFGFISANSCDLPFSVEDLHKASGSQAKRLAAFNEQLVEALEQLKEQGCIQGFVAGKGTVKISK